MYGKRAKVKIEAVDRRVSKQIPIPRILLMAWDVSIPAEAKNSLNALKCVCLG